MRWTEFFEERQGRPASRRAVDMERRVLAGAAVSRLSMLSVNNFQYPAPGTGWTPTIQGAYLGPLRSAKKLWLPIPIVAGDILESYILEGDAVETTALTLDCKITSIIPGDAMSTYDITSGAIVQVAADGIVTTEIDLNSFVPVTGEHYLFEIQGSTSTSDEITIAGVRFRINRRLPY